MKKVLVSMLTIVAVLLIFSSQSLAIANNIGNNDVEMIQDTLPAPEGFVAEDNIAGSPVGSGEAFLAAGPNNVEENNIKYRLYYSKTDDAPDDPKEASEYQFGTTAGDGDGETSFGFTKTGLAPATDYTFWLYQYNSVDELFSEPAIATVISGGDGDTTQVGDNIVFNGDFSDSLSS